MKQARDFASVVSDFVSYHSANTGHSHFAAFLSFFHLQNFRFFTT